MKTKQLIERNLKFSEQYIYLEIIRGSIESGQMCTCDNCGKLITNMVKVARKSDRKTFYIGTDCAETLSTAKCLYNNGNATDFYLDIYAYNLAARFVTELNAGCKISHTSLVSTHLINRKGKEIQCYTGNLKKWFPQYINQFSDKTA
jgi:hypothetical protein